MIQFHNVLRLAFPVLYNSDPDYKGPDPDYKGPDPDFLLNQGKRIQLWLIKIF